MINEQDSNAQDGGASATDTTQTGGQSGETHGGDQKDTKAAPPAPAVNIKLRSGKNPATGENWTPLTEISIGQEQTKITLPDAETQKTGAFHHDRAADIAAHFANYVLVKPKG